MRSGLVNKTLFKSFLRFGLPILIAFLLILGFISIFEIKNLRSRNQIIQESLIKEKRNFIGNTVEQITNDLNFLSTLPDFEDFTPGSYYRKQRLEEQIRAFMKHRKNYSEIAVISSDGWEKLHIGYENNTIVTTKRINLENRQSSEFFRQLSELDSNEIYLSTYIPEFDSLQAGETIIQTACILSDSLVNQQLYLYLKFKGHVLPRRVTDSSFFVSSLFLLLSEDGSMLENLLPISHAVPDFIRQNRKGFVDQFSNEWELMKGHPGQNHFNNHRGCFTYLWLNCCDYLNELEGNKHIKKTGNCSSWILLSYTNRNEFIHSIYSPVIKKYIVIWLLGSLIILILTALFDNILHEQQTERRRRQVQFRFMESLIEAIPNPIFFIDYENNEFGCNEAFVTMTGKKKEELDEMHIEQFFQSAERSRKSTDLDTDTLRVSEMKLKFPDGTLHNLLYYKARMQDDNKSIGLVGIFNDITSIRETEQALRDSESKLRAANRTKNRFFSLIAHDLKNPFHAIMGLTHLLLSNYSEISERDKKNILENIYQSTENTFQLLLNLLDWARLQEGKIKSKPAKISLDTIARETVQLLKTRIQEKDLNTVVSVNNNHFAWADDNMVRTILRNLLSNAIKFTDIGGHINIAVKTVDNHLEVSVKDDGAGISSTDQQFLFKPDRKGNANSVDGGAGTGLGLLLCKDFVELNNGSIGVESQVGKGSVFHFTLPAYND